MKSKKMVSKRKKLKSTMSNLFDNLELILLLIGGLSLPVLVFCYYFTVIPRGEERETWLARLFLILTILYVIFSFIFAWKALKGSKGWQKIIEDKENRKKGKK